MLFLLGIKFCGRSVMNAGVYLEALLAESDLPLSKQLPCLKGQESQLRSL